MKNRSLEIGRAEENNRKGNEGRKAADLQGGATLVPVENSSFPIQTECILRT